MATDWQAHSAVAAWCGLAISLLALVASLGSAAFTALQTSLGRALACRSTGYLCAPQSLFVHLWTVDFVSRPEPPILPSELGPVEPPELIDGWATLAAAFSSGAPGDVTADRTRSEGCISIAAVARAVTKGDEVRRMDETWRVDAVSGPTILGETDLRGGRARRRLMLEAQVDFPDHRAPLHATLAVQASDGFRHLDGLDYVFELTLPAGIDDADLLCALPQYAPGSYQLTILATGGVGADVVQQQQIALLIAPPGVTGPAPVP